MLRHAVSHQDMQFTCDKCPSFGTNTPGGLHQHMKGAHGPGWDAKCGENFQWPSQRRRHEKHCKKCEAAYLHEERQEILHRAKAINDDPKKKKDKHPKK